jgi:hypothetical protein
MLTKYVLLAINGDHKDEKPTSESMIKYTTKVAMSGYKHIFTHKCKKVESKPF